MAYKRKETENPVVHRVVNIDWTPRTKEEWRTFTASRREAAELWDRMARIHQFFRKRHRQTWPDKNAYRRWATRKKFGNLNSQSVQLIIDEFLKAVKSARVLRKKGDSRARYPRVPRIGWDRKRRYRDVPYKNNTARIRDGYIVLPNSGSGNLVIPIPKGYTGVQTGPTDKYVTVGDKYTGRLMEAQLAFGVLRLVLAVEVKEVEADKDAPIIGVDLGVNTLIAASDGKRALLISGRGIKSLVRYRNKKLGEITRKQTKKTQGLTKTKGSRSWKKLQRAKRKMLASNKRRVNNLIHKATRQVADAFPGAMAYVGKPFNDAARKHGRKTAQTVSSACNRRIIEQLGYKLKEAKEVEEHYTSQTCPKCGNRCKCKRVYRCKCGFTAPRDVVGATNIRSKGQTGSIATGATAPTSLTYSRPGATRDCDRADIHGLQHPLGDAVDARVEAAQGREQSQTGVPLQSPVTPRALPRGDSER